MRPLHRILAVAAFGVLAASGMAQNLVGVWKGKVEVDMSQLPKNLTPQQKQMMDQGLAVAKKMVITLNLRANKTYMASVTGLPQAAAQKGPNTNEGTWRVQGSKLFLTSVKENGKPAKSKTPQQFTIAPGGKSFWLQGGPGGKVVFRR